MNAHVRELELTAFCSGRSDVHGVLSRRIRIKLASATVGFVVATLVSCLFAGQAAAARIVLDFVGEINNVQGTAVGGPYLIADAVVGRPVFDPDAAIDRIPDAPEFGRYNPDSIESFTLTAGTYQAEGDPLARQRGSGCCHA